MAKIVSEVKVITNLVRFSYLNVFEPQKNKENLEEPGKYSASIIIPKSDKETIKCIKQAIEAAKMQGKANKWNGKVPASMDVVLHDGDTEREEDEAYKNSYFLSAKCNEKPGLVDININPITDSKELYSGCYGRASVTFYPYLANGKKGIACGLNNLQKIKDGEYLGGRASAKDDFDDDWEDDDDDL
ncbi:MAG: DUF2815 family protein [Anaeroplasma sp.]